MSNVDNKKRMRPLELIGANYLTLNVIHNPLKNEGF